MAELNLEHYAIKQRWNLWGADVKWEVLIAEYLETLAHRCDETGTCVIGHIKALALFPNGGYLRVSVVSPTLPAGVEGSVPEGCIELVLTVNVIVYGVGGDFLEQITRNTATDLSEKWTGGVTIMEI